MMKWSEMKDRSRANLSLTRYLFLIFPLILSLILFQQFSFERFGFPAPPFVGIALGIVLGCYLATFQPTYIKFQVFEGMQDKDLLKAKRNELLSSVIFSLIGLMLEEIFFKGLLFWVFSFNDPIVALVFVTMMQGILHLVVSFRKPLLKLMVKRKYYLAWLFKSILISTLFLYTGTVVLGIMVHILDHYFTGARIIRLAKKQELEAYEDSNHSLGEKTINEGLHTRKSITDQKMFISGACCIITGVILSTILQFTFSVFFNGLPPYAPARSIDSYALSFLVPAMIFFSTGFALVVNARKNSNLKKKTSVILSFAIYLSSMALFLFKSFNDSFTKAQYWCQHLFYYNCFNIFYQSLLSGPFVAFNFINMFYGLWVLVDIFARNKSRLKIQYSMPILPLN
ncbi:MAG: type II CAAX prenyl endopeptidase Rce1 family protein [Candidatus Hodarchaeota archaeon]